MYDSLPKNPHDRLDPLPVRYALHRYFLQKHGWYVNGLGVANDENDTSAATTIMTHRAPSFIQSIFAKRLNGQGLNLRDLAVFAATLADLIHNEVSGHAERVYAALELPTVGPVTEKEHEMASKAYLLAYLSGGRETVGKKEELPAVELSWDADYPAWNDTLMWVSDLKLTTEFSNRDHLNPFKQHMQTFDRHVSFLQEVGHRLGAFQNLECQRLKNELVEIEDDGTGRVPLSRFYRGVMSGDWQFSERVDYLRHIGALDETDSKRMSVVIPNYIQSQSNCIAGSSFYSVCCFDECEGLLGHVEREVRAPSASPTQIIAIVSNMQSDTVHAPRNLSSALLSRLGDIARLHGGSVPVHGRLFAQWMHHAYPRECRFPHVIGVTRRSSPSEWMEAMDIDSAEASEEEIAALVRLEQEALTPEVLTPEDKAEALPWTMAEELLAGHMAMKEVSPANTQLPAWRVAAALLVLVSLVAPMTFHQVAPKQHDSKERKYFV